MISGLPGTFGSVFGMKHVGKNNWRREQNYAEKKRERLSRRKRG